MKCITPTNFSIFQLFVCRVVYSLGDISGTRQTINLKELMANLFQNPNCSCVVVLHPCNIPFFLRHHLCRSTDVKQGLEPELVNEITLELYCTSYSYCMCSPTGTRSTNENELLYCILPQRFLFDLFHTLLIFECLWPFLLFFFFCVHATRYIYIYIYKQPSSLDFKLNQSTKPIINIELSFMYIIAQSKRIHKKEDLIN